MKPPRWLWGLGLGIMGLDAAGLWWLSGRPPLTLETLGILGFGSFLSLPLLLSAAFLLYLPFAFLSRLWALARWLVFRWQ